MGLFSLIDNNLSFIFFNFSLSSLEGPILFFLPVLTFEDSPINNIKIRQAVSYSLDREKILKVAYGGKLTGSIARRTLVPNNDPLFNSKQVIYERNIQKAKRLIKEAGYSGEVNINLPWLNIVQKMGYYNIDNNFIRLPINIYSLSKSTDNHILLLSAITGKGSQTILKYLTESVKKSKVI